MEDKLIQFIRTKDYKLIQNIGQGGTDKTVLLVDELINEKFVCKKYEPFFEEDKDIYYKNFVDEIKLLHMLYHNNIVRVFNYYLYPDYKTGYILMEFINGATISEFVKKNPDRLNDVFIQTIRGFRHLEENKILHRDIRPENILVSNNGVVKIIDFGFGKKIEFDGTFDNSISLNWRYTIPKDFEFKTYNYQTEVYFIGKLFEEMIQENDLQNFPYKKTLLKMIKINPKERLLSFFDVDREIIEFDSSGIEFSHVDKTIYQNFADSIQGLYSKIEDNAQYIKDIDLIISSLEDCYRNSILENYIQSQALIGRCFIKGQYFYFNKVSISVDHLKDFLGLLKSVSSDKKKIIINNLWQRFDRVPRYGTSSEDEDLPF